MVKVEGTYTSVKGQDFVDFYAHLGVPKETVQTSLGSHWTMKIWKDGNVWGAHVTCKEHPHLNSLDAIAEGVEKCVDTPMFGGKAKVVFRSTGDGEFLTTIESEKFGTLLWEEKYTDEGAHHKITGKGKTLTEFWERSIKPDGAYRFVKGENVENFFKATGSPEMIQHYKNYRVYFQRKGDTLNMLEWFGDLGKVHNAMKADVESPYRVPGDKPDADGSYKLILTKTGNGKCLMVLKSPAGNIEEWKLTFSNCGLVVNGLEKQTGQTCTFHMERFVETSGTYKLVTSIGFEHFAQNLGMPSNKIQEIANDHSAKLIVCDKGNGFHRHQYIGNDHSLDVSFKLNEEFTFLHPFLHENVKGVAAMNGSQMCMLIHTSKGTLKATYHFNDNFVIKSVCHPGANVGYKVIMERSCEW